MNITQNLKSGKRQYELGSTYISRKENKNMINDALGDRMKKYEAVSKTALVTRMPVVIRLDGKAFHTFTRGFRKPFDDVLIKTMQATMKYLCENIQGCVLGYTQSDEITLVLQDYKELNTSAWFDYEVQKMCSISAAMATFAFNKFFRENVEEYSKSLVDDLTLEQERLMASYQASLQKGAFFDSRVFNVPKEDVTNCVYWRQKDAERNSINSLAQSLFSHKSLQGLKLKDTLTKIEAEKGIIWGNLPTTYKRGSCCVKQEIVTALNDDLSPVVKVDWVIDNEIPMFKGENREYVEKLVYIGE